MCLFLFSTSDIHIAIKSDEFRDFLLLASWAPNKSDTTIPQPRPIIIWPPPWPLPTHFFLKFLADTHVLFGATGTPVLDFF